MTLNDVEKAICHGRQVIESHGYYLNESSTRYAIIDPILRALGWKLEDPNECQFEQWRSRAGKEYSGKVDYILYYNQNPVIIIEAKRCRRSMWWSKTEERQLSSYFPRRRDSVRSAILTNGQMWYPYDLSKPTKFEYKFDSIRTVDISCGSTLEAAKMLNKLLGRHGRSKWWQRTISNS